jgi:hypothetical protein
MNFVDLIAWFLVVGVAFQLIKGLVVGYATVVRENSSGVATVVFWGVVLSLFAQAWAFNHLFRFR